VLFLIAVAARAELFLAGPRTYLPRAGEAVDARRITVDRQGMVWVSGKEGAFRFDGLRYLPASRLGLPVSGATRFAVTSDGTVWAIGVESLYRLEAGRFRRIAPVLNVARIAAAGELLYVSSQGLQVWYRAGSGWKSARQEQGPEPGQDLHGEPDGRVWFGGPSSAEWVRWNDGKFEYGSEALPLDSGTSRHKEVVSMPNGTLYAANTTSVSRLAVQASGRLKLMSSQVTDIPMDSRALGGDSRELWYQVCGVWVSSTGRALGLPGVREMQPDLASGAWGAAGEKGLIFAGRNSVVKTLSLPQLPDRIVRGLARDGKQLFVAREDAPARLTDGQPTPICDGTSSQEPALEPWMISGEEAPYVDVAADADGSLWVLGRKQGVLHLNREGRLMGTVPDETGDPRWVGTLHTMALSPDGRLWIGGKRNLIEVTRQPLAYRAVFPGVRYAATFTRDRQNRLFAITEGGLAQYREGVWQDHPWPACLLSPYVRTVAIASEDDHWIGYRRGDGFTRATRLNGTWRCQHFLAEHGLPGDTQFLHFDGQGRLWRGSNTGLYFSRQTPLRKEDWIRLGEEVGILPGEMHPLFHEEPDGAILVASGKHLLRIPPRLLERDPGVAPQVSYMEDPNGLALGPSALTWRLGEGARLYLSALPERELAAAAPIEHRFDGGAWTALAGHELALDDAPRGAQLLELRYRGGRAGLSLPLRILIPWWRTLPFLSAMVVGLMGLGASLVGPIRRYRYQASKRRFLARAAEPAAGHWTPGTLLRGRYRIEGLLARGGFSDVFAAIDKPSGRRVVVKRLRQGEQTADHLRRRFTQEVAAVSMVRHPGVVPILDTWIDADGVPHLVLPRVDGPTLRQRLNQGRMERIEALGILKELAAILAAAHAHGVVHSDLKPENILLAEGKPVVIDFGTSALQMQASLSEYSRPAGSIQYMAPEQLLGRYSTATDVYAFALLSLELLSGRRYGEFQMPFDGGWEAALTAALTGALTGALAGETGFNADTAAVFVKGLRFDPEQRERNLATWFAELEAALC